MEKWWFHVVLYRPWYTFLNFEILLSVKSVGAFTIKLDEVGLVETAVYTIYDLLS